LTSLPHLSFSPGYERFAARQQTLAWDDFHQRGSISRRRLLLSEFVTVWAVTSDATGWFSGRRRADPRRLCRLLGLTGEGSVARRRPRTLGVT
jgi:hypothetical protein